MRLTLRADAGDRIGAGHLMRCVALARAALAQDDRVFLVSGELPDRIAGQLRSCGIDWWRQTAPCGSPADAEATVAAGDGRPGWVVLDGYHFGPEFQAALRAAGPRLLVLDDHAHLPSYRCDALANPAGEDLRDRYLRLAPGGALLLGPRYAMIRPEFRRPGRRGARDESARQLLLTFGAADPGDVTGQLLDALERVPPPLAVRVLVGPLNPRLAELARRAELSAHAIQLVDGSKTSDLPRLMASADLALTAAGSTCWELACLGVPALVVETADNQRWVAAVLAAAGAVERCGRWGDQDPSELAERVAALLADRVRLTAMGTAGRRLVDGRGADRVLKYCRASLEGRACE